MWSCHRRNQPRVWSYWKTVSVFGPGAAVASAHCVAPNPAAERPHTARRSSMDMLPWPSFVYLCHIISDWLIPKSTSHSAHCLKTSWPMLAYATWSLHAYCATCETPTCDTKMPTCEAQPRCRNCNLKQSKILLKRRLRKTYLPCCYRYLKESKTSSKAPVKEQLKCWVDDLRQWQVGDNDLAVSGHEFLSLCTVTATPMPVDSVSAWLQPFFVHTSCAPMTVFAVSRVMKIIAHTHNEALQVQNPAFVWRMGNVKFWLAANCFAKHWYTTYNATKRQTGGYVTPLSPQRQHGRIQKVLLQQQVAVKSIWSLLSTTVYNFLLSPSTVYYCPWSRFDGESSSPDVLSQSPTSFWGSTWHWLYLTLNATRLLVKVEFKTSGLFKVLWVRYLSPAKSLPAVKKSN